ncbi:MAG TPA: protease HtpX, partial [Sphingomonas sp.]|nr:protease HtpX [Sphingomonas sp.]
QLYIVPGLRGGGDNMFSTHPDTGNRIAALEAIAMEMGAMEMGAVEMGGGSAQHPAPRATAGPSVPVTRKARRASALDPLRRP